MPIRHAYWAGPKFGKSRNSPSAWELPTYLGFTTTWRLVENTVPGTGASAQLLQGEPTGCVIGGIGGIIRGEFKAFHPQAVCRLLHLPGPFDVLGRRRCERCNLGHDVLSGGLIHSPILPFRGLANARRTQPQALIPVARLAELSASHAWGKATTGGGMIVATLPWFEDKELTARITPVMERIKEGRLR